MKRVLILGYFFPPSKAAGTFRTLRFVRDLPGLGWRPEVLTVLDTTYPGNELDPELLHRVPNEVHVHRAPAPPLHRWFKSFIHALRTPFVSSRPEQTARNSLDDAPSVVSRNVESARPKRLPRPGSITEWIYTWLRTPDIDAAWYPFAVLRGLWLILRKRPDVLYATGGPWMTFLVARDLSRLTRVPLVLDYRDPWSFNPAARRGGGFFEKLAQALEKSVVRQANRVIANTDVLRQTLIEAHGQAVAAKTVIINNSYDESNFETPDPPQARHLTLAYVGSLYDAHSPDPFLRALKLLFENKAELRGSFKVKLVGSGAPRTTQQVLGYGLDDIVEVQGPVSHAQALHLQRSSQVLLLFLTVASDHSTFIPSKLFEYIAARRPIFAVTRGGALQRLLERRQLTPWIYTPDDLTAMAEGIEQVVDRYERQCLPSLAEDTVRSFGGAAAAASLAAVLQDAAGDSGSRRTSPDESRGEPLQPAGTETP